MRRPKASEYINELGTVDWDAYHMELEKYCTKLEEAVCYLSYKLDEYGICNETFECNKKIMTCYTCWKEWAMKDE